MSRRILGCKNNMPSEVLRGELGWVTLASRRSMLRLFFWERLLQAKGDSWLRLAFQCSRQMMNESSGQQLVQSHKAGALQDWARAGMGGSRITIVDVPEERPWKDLVSKVEERYGG